MKTAIRGSIRFLNVVLYAFVCLFQAYTRFQKVDQKEKGRIIRYYTRKVLTKAGVKCIYDGKIPESLHQCGISQEAPSWMVVSNHVSWLDIFTLDAQIPSRFIAKAEIAKWPVFGLIAQAIGTLFINRSSKRAILKINDDIRAALCNREAVAIFAEGTTTFGNELLPIKSNFFAPAKEIGATVLPVIIVYTEKGKPTRKAAFAGDVSLFGSLWNVVTLEEAGAQVHFLEPIVQTKEMIRHEIGRLCEERMRAKLKEIWGDDYREIDEKASQILAQAIGKGS